MDYFERVKGLARANNTTIEAVAIAAGLTRDSYNSYRKKGNLPRADESQAIADFLETTNEYLVKGIAPRILSSPDVNLLEWARQYRDLLRDYDCLDDGAKRTFRVAIRAAAEDKLACVEAEAPKTEGLGQEEALARKTEQGLRLVKKGDPKKA